MWQSKTSSQRSTRLLLLLMRKEYFNLLQIGFVATLLYLQRQWELGLLGLLQLLQLFVQNQKRKRQQRREKQLKKERQQRREKQKLKEERKKVEELLEQLEKEKTEAPEGSDTQKKVNHMLSLAREKLNSLKNHPLSVHTSEKEEDTDGISN